MESKKREARVGTDSAEDRVCFRDHFHPGYMAMRFTLAQAAEKVGCDKSTIYKQIRRGVISAIRAEDGRYFVDASELFRIFPEAGNTMDQLGTVQGNSMEAARIKDLEKMVSLLESERDFLRERLSQADEERRKLSALLTDQSEKISAPTAEPALRLVDKLFRRGRV